MQMYHENRLTIIFVPSVAVEGDLQSAKAFRRFWAGRCHCTMVLLARPGIEVAPLASEIEVEGHLGR